MFRGGALPRFRDERSLMPAPIEHRDLVARREVGLALDQFQVQEGRRVFTDPIVALVDAGQIRGWVDVQMDERKGAAQPTFEQIMVPLFAAQENVGAVVGDPRRHRLGREFHSEQGGDGRPAGPHLLQQLGRPQCVGGPDVFVFAQHQPDPTKSAGDCFAPGELDCLKVVRGHCGQPGMG